LLATQKSCELVANYRVVGN